MLVEDDKNLREIYGVRLLAEGYDIVSAGDGEEALAMAIKERPKLIVSDVMMPKISGFDMLDILRSTTETRDIKVIMMTALSSEEQRQRGEALGADRYLVKSQVGIEDVVRVVHEVLGDQEPAAAPAAAAPAPVAPPVAPVQPVRPAAPVAPRPVEPAPAPVVVEPVPPAAAIPVPTPLSAAPIPAPEPVPAPPAPAPVAAEPVPPAPVPAVDPTATPRPSSIRTRIITPLNDPSTQPVDINELLNREIAREAGISDDARPVVATTEQEQAIISQQLSQFSIESMTPPPEEETTPPLPPTPPTGV